MTNIKTLVQHKRQAPCLLTLLAAICLISVPSYAQKFDKDGLFEGKGDKFRYPATVNVTHAASVLSTKETAAIKLKISELVQRALINAQDAGIRKQYEDIWGSTFVKEYMHELKTLQVFLQTGATDHTTYKWVPSPKELNDGIFNKAPLDVEAASSNDLAVARWLSVKKDLFNDFIIARWKATLAGDNIDAYIVNESYLFEWRKLEQWYGRTLSEAKEIKRMDSAVTFDLQRLSDIETNQQSRDIATRTFVKDIQQSKFLRKWLWFTGGIVTMNPLGAAQPGWAYPAGEPNSFLTARLATVQDSLNRSTHLKDITRTRVIFNEVQLLIEHPVPDPKNKLKWLIEYNAADHFKKTNTIDVEKVEKQTYQIAVHNIEKGRTVTIAQSESELKDESKTITAINELADQLGVITQYTKPNLATFNALRERLNPVTEADIQMRYTEQGDWILKSRVGGYRVDSFYQMRPDPRIPLTQTDLNEDKRRMIGARMGDMPADQRRFFEKVLPKFLKDDQYNFVDYSNINTINVSMKRLVERFQLFLETVFKHSNRASEVLEEVNKKNAELEPYIAIYNRSLPSNDLEGYLDDKITPAYTSRLYTPAFPEAPKKLTYLIADKREGGEQKQVVKETTKITRRHLFDVSIGLAYTFQDYDVVSQSGKNMPTVDVGDRFNFMAGLHWYFTGLNKIDDAWWKQDGRWSLYAGLSLTNALDNFYGGISYDPTPGIRWIVGVHLYKDYRFKIINDQIAEKATGIKVAGPFLSLSLEPVTVGKAIGLFR